MSQSRSGYIVAFQVAPAAPSVLGQVLNGVGVPPNTIGPGIPYGQNGDSYNDLLTGNSYTKSNGAWILQGQQGQAPAASLQLVAYTSGNPDPPKNQNQPALAYDPNGVLPLRGWNTVSKQWT